MRVNFFHWHVRDTVFILEKVNLLHPRFPCCNILLPWSAMNRSHLANAQCARGAERKRRRVADEKLQEISERAFQAYVEPLNNVTDFKYLGRVLMVGNYDWSAVAGNLQKSRKSWLRMLRILSRYGADLKVSGHLFKAAVQAVLIFGSDTWVLTPRMERALGIFQHSFARRITGM